MVKHAGKRGDTLIEVMLAVGIFSMVAVAVVAVMSGGTSRAQGSLESTLAREEIDTQAEALRFIHRSYITDKNVGTSSAFGELWQTIVSRAINANDVNNLNADATQFHPTSCNDLYAMGGDAEKGFVIDPRRLTRVESGTPTSPIITTAMRDSSNQAYLQPASTYPHLLYHGDEGAMVNDSNASGRGDLYRAEGIYIVAVKDPNSTSMVGSYRDTSAYYDFYIRTCWYGTGDQEPSTISTVIRLYNPDIASGS